MGLPITEAVYAGRVVTEVPPPTLDGECADLTHPSALAVGVTGELSATSDYGLTQEWAAELWAAGLEGIRYAPRFTPGGSAAWALFGRSGAQPERGAAGHRPLLDVLEELRLPVVRSEQLTGASRDVQDSADL